MKCSYCGSTDHPWFNCRKKPDWKPPKKSTAVRKDVRQDEPHEVLRAGGGAAAGTQAPPVDTLTVIVTDVPFFVHDIKPKRGRPRTGFDKKAYDAERMKKARLLKKLNAAGVFILPEKL